MNASLCHRGLSIDGVPVPVYPEMVALKLREFMCFAGETTWCAKVSDRCNSLSDIHDTLEENEWLVLTRACDSTTVNIMTAQRSSEFSAI